MNRFKDLYSSSDSEEQTQQSQSYQRGRERENKRFTQNIKENQAEKAKKQLKKKHTQQLRNKTQKIITQNESLFIEVNEYTSGSTLKSSQKFIRQNVKPAQQQIKHYLQKMLNTRDQRKKFTNALTTCSRDLQKVCKKIQLLKASQLSNRHSSTQLTSNTQPSESQQGHSQQLKTMIQLQSKIQRHLSNLMSEHHKTIELLMESRKQMEKNFTKVKFSFLQLDKMEFLQQESQKYVQYGIQKIYQLFEKADQILNQVTAFNT